MREIILIAHNLRSCYNVGSLLRAAEGLGVKEVIFTGYTPYPAHDDDQRLPHEARKTDTAIHKTALDAEHQVPWRHVDSIYDVIHQLKDDGFTVVALEQSEGSLNLPEYSPPDKIALLVGREVEGIEPEVLKVCSITVEIPMFGRKESFNVVQAAGMALYHCRFSK